MELPHLDVEVWLLYAPQSVAERGHERRQAVEIGRHGLQISRGESRGLLLPGVAVEHGYDAEAFLHQVCLKAGLPPTAWKDDDTVLSTFEGHSIAGALADLLPSDVQTLSPPRFSSNDVAALAEFCRANILATARGATPNYYAYGVSDGNVHGVAVTVEGGDGTQWLHSSRLSLRQSMPLQSTLYGLAESLGQTLARAESLSGPLDQMQLGLTILYDPAMHGTLGEPDLRGFDPARRALVALENNKSAIVYDPTLSPPAMAELAGVEARIRLPQAASLFSLEALSNRSRMIVAQAPQAQPAAAARPAAVAGKFYPGDAAALAHLVDDLLSGPAPEVQEWPAVMVPHAGLKYSGRLAADVLRRVKIPGTAIIIGPKHTPHGVDWAVAPHATWSIPGGAVQGDLKLARQLAAAIDGLELDAAAHQQEHAIEVELPVLARLAPATRVVGIAIGAGNLAMCRRFADGLAQCLRSLPERPLLIISSDMNHFASDEENRRLDELALSAMESLDAERLLETCRRQHISMCGVLPAVIVMETLKRLGSLSRTQRVGYATSGDVTGDRSRVVGYAGMLLG
jgi:AmmeMemoRadiSam system protein B